MSGRHIKVCNRIRDISCQVIVSKSCLGRRARSRQLLRRSPHSIDNERIRQSISLFAFVVHAHSNTQTPTSTCPAYNHHHHRHLPNMSPDINTIHNTSGSPLAHRPRRISLAGTDGHVAQPGPPSPRSPRSPSLSSLQAAATLNAGLQRSPASPSPVRNTIERRRSSLLNNFTLNDPSIPAPGEMQSTNNPHSPSTGRRRSSVLAATADPHHHRQPSLGELHQELEAETEGQVNRLLHMGTELWQIHHKMSSHHQMNRANKVSVCLALLPTGRTLLLAALLAA